MTFVTGGQSDKRYPPATESIAKEMLQRPIGQRLALNNIPQEAMTGNLIYHNTMLKILSERIFNLCPDQSYKMCDLLPFIPKLLHDTSAQDCEKIIASISNAHTFIQKLMAEVNEGKRLELDCRTLNFETSPGLFKSPTMLAC